MSDTARCRVIDLVRIERFISFWERQVPLVKITERRRRRPPPTSEERKKADDAAAASWRYRRRQKFELEPVEFELPMRNILAAWCKQAGLPVHVKYLARVKRELRAILITRAEFWSRMKRP